MSVRRRATGDRSPRRGRTTDVPDVPPTPAPAATDLRGFVHTAVCHRTTAELVDAVTPSMRGWLSMRDPVFVNLSSRRLHALRAAVGRDADRVRWSDTYRWAPHPARRLRAIQELVDGAERHVGGQLRFVGECAFPSGPPELVAEWERFDAMLNEVFAGSPVTMVCAYDVASLPDDVAESVGRTHPATGVDPVVPSPDYERPQDFLDTQGALPPLPEGATHEGGRVPPSRARELVREVAGGARSGGPAVPAGALDDLMVVATELVTNAWHAGAGRIEVWCWRSECEMGVQVDDDGPGLRDPYAGYRRPSTLVAGGRGLWIVRQLADLVEIAHGEQGTSIRARVFDAVRAHGDHARVARR